MTEERPTVEPVAPSTPESVKPERTSGNFGLFLSFTVLIAVAAWFVQSSRLQERVKELLTSTSVSASTMPSTIISRDALYISEVLTDDRAEQEEIDRAFDVFSGLSGGLNFSVLSLWDVYDYLVVEKARSGYYSLFFSNSPPVWQTDDKTKRRELHINGPQLWVTVRNEKTYEGNKPWPYSHSARMVKVRVNMGDVLPKEGWIRFITTKDFRINSYGEKSPRPDRVALAEFFRGKYPSGKKTIYTQVVQ